MVLGGREEARWLGRSRTSVAELEAGAMRDVRGRAEGRDEAGRPWPRWRPGRSGMSMAELEAGAMRDVRGRAGGRGEEGRPWPSWRPGRCRTSVAELEARAMRDVRRESLEHSHGRSHPWPRAESERLSCTVLGGREEAGWLGRSPRGSWRPSRTSVRRGVKNSLPRLHYAILSHARVPKELTCERHSAVVEAELECRGGADLNETGFECKGGADLNEGAETGPT